MKILVLLAKIKDLLKMLSVVSGKDLTKNHDIAKQKPLTAARAAATSTILRINHGVNL